MTMRLGLLFLSLLSLVLFWLLTVLSVIALAIFLLSTSHCGPRKRQRGATKVLWLPCTWSLDNWQESLSIFCFLLRIFFLQYFFPFIFHTHCLLRNSHTFTLDWCNYKYLFLPFRFSLPFTSTFIFVATKAPCFWQF